MPCLRHTSAADSTAWCSFKIPMICSSVNLLLRIVRLLPEERTLTNIRGRFRGAGHYARTVGGLFICDLLVATGAIDVEAILTLHLLRGLAVGKPGFLEASDTGEAFRGDNQ